MDYKQEAEKIFSNDIFATKQAGIIIDEVDINYAKCSMPITPSHLNAAGTVMGGAIYTLADFCYSVAANAGNPVTVTLNSTVNFISAAKSDILYAEAKCVKSGRSICFYDVRVYDDSDKTVATVCASGFRKA